MSLWSARAPDKPGNYWITNYITVDGVITLSRGKIPILVFVYKAPGDSRMRVAWYGGSDKPFVEHAGAGLTRNDDTGSTLWQAVALPLEDAPEPTLVRPPKY